MCGLSRDQTFTQVSYLGQVQTIEQRIQQWLTCQPVQRQENPHHVGEIFHIKPALHDFKTGPTGEVDE